MDVPHQALVEVCQRHGVRRLSAFGSAARGQPDPRDIDLIVDIAAPTPSAYADRYLMLKEDLEALFGKPVDLVTEGSLANPYFRRRVEAEKALLFKA